MLPSLRRYLTAISPLFWWHLVAMEGRHLGQVHSDGLRLLVDHYIYRLGIAGSAGGAEGEVGVKEQP